MVKVIVAITTYNLEHYISYALDSVINQKTNFDFKILIADDCSTDNTIKILYDYKQRFPDLIEILLSDKNLGSLKNSNRLLDHIECEYFSFLDGDDYWIDNQRLQKQVDFMDSHVDCSMCAGNTQFLVDGVLSEMLIKKKDLNKYYTIDDYIHSRMPYPHTSSILLRNTIFIHGLPKCYYEVCDTFEECALRGEDFRRLIHLQKGSIYIMDELLSVYRIHRGGMWQGSSNFHKVVEAAITYNFYNKYFGDSFGDYFKKRAKIFYQKVIFLMLVNNLLLPECHIEKKDCSLISHLLVDYSNNLNGEYQISEHKYRTYILKFLSKIFHIL